MREVFSRVRVVRADEFFESRPALRVGHLVEFADESASISVSNAGVSIGRIGFAGRLQLTLVGRHRLGETVRCHFCPAVEEFVKRGEFDGFEPSVRSVGCCQALRIR